jgi:hypothetical protein
MTQAFVECSVHAREMCLLYRRLYQNATIKFTWGSLHILFLGGLTYLYCLWKSKHVRETARRADVVNTCMACTTVLVIIAERWKTSASYRDIFEALSERTINMICGDGTRPDTTGTPTVASQRFGTDATPTADTPPLVPDWVVGLDDMAIPQESEWLVQELLQGVRDFQPNSLDRGGTADANALPRARY